MSLVHDLLQVARTGGIPDLRDFRRHIDPAWMEEALQATGTATVWRRRLRPNRSYCFSSAGMGHALIW